MVMALGTALASVAGFLYKFKGARKAPEVQMAAPLRSTLALFRSPIYALGIGCALVGWFLHVGALALAPISLVQATIAGGLVLVNVAAERLFDIPVSRREWVGVLLTAAGLATLAGTLDGAGESAHSLYGQRSLFLYLVIVGGAAVALGLAAGRRRSGNWLAVSAGLYWAVSDTAIKALSGHASALGIGVLITPLAGVILVASVVGLLVSAQSLQLGEAVPVIALTSVAANLTTIAAGPLVFAEPLPVHAGAIVLRLGAFLLVVVAASMTPPPLPPANPAEA